MRVFGKCLATDAPAVVILIRLLVGTVFLSEGIQKFLFPDALGAGRFAKIGIPYPGFSGPFVGAFEIACGVLVLLGLGTRFAAVPLLLVIAVAIISTKFPMLSTDGFWKMAHESRTDWSMLLGLLFLLVVGGGRWSLDALLFGQPRGGAESPVIVRRSG
jgi:putative oxidoreductase